MTQFQVTREIKQLRATVKKARKQDVPESKVGELLEQIYELQRLWPS